MIMTIEIYQIEAKDENRDIIFNDYENVKKYIPNLYENFKNRYKKVFTDCREQEDKTDMEILEDLFYEFNMEHPENYKGKSLSVSDIVVLSKAPYDIAETPYFCDRFGWEQIRKE